MNIEDQFASNFSQLNFKSHHIHPSSNLMSSTTPVLSAWQQLRNQSITCEQALKNLVDDQGILNLKLLDRDVSFRFFREFPDRNVLPPMIS